MLFSNNGIIPSHLILMIKNKTKGAGRKFVPRAVLLACPPQVQEPCRFKDISLAFVHSKVEYSCVVKTSKWCFHYWISFYLSKFLTILSCLFTSWLVDLIHSVSVIQLEVSKYV